MVDDVSRHNQAQWDELAHARLEYTLPLLDLTPVEARRRVDPLGILGERLSDFAGKAVLCLATGGGQQSACFALLGARVTVVDLSATQLARDQEAAAHYDFSIRTIHSDMRDLSALGDDSFDLVYQAYSINFVPSVAPVFAEVARVLRPGGLYHMQWANPFTQSVDDQAWDGETYLLHHPYVDGYEVSTYYPTWDIEDGEGGWRTIQSPREFRHILSTVVNTLTEKGFVILRLQEAMSSEEEPEPGTWEHYKWVAPPYLTLWATYRPEVFAVNQR
ncbi:MAG TPA: class I SAM-dependent methyltransferase [Caldilineaceae bacterium]|nr:class I SAM-dependent methyltransferase [Caldilineaceae bacterium]